LVFLRKDQKAGNKICRSFPTRRRKKKKKGKKKGKKKKKKKKGQEGHKVLRWFTRYANEEGRNIRKVHFMHWAVTRGRTIWATGGVGL